MIIQPSCVSGTSIYAPSFYASLLRANASRMCGSSKGNIYVRRSVSAGHRLGLSYPGNSGTVQLTRVHASTSAFGGMLLRGVIRQITIGLSNFNVIAYGRILSADQLLRRMSNACMRRQTTVISRYRIV